MNQEWSIQSRSERCSITGEPFQDGEYFYTLLFHEKEGLRREDLSEAAWKARDSSREPFSFWRSKFEPPPPPSPEPLGKQTAEDLLRQYMQEGDSQHASARYILALMLERKRLLKQVEARKGEGRRTHPHLRARQNRRGLRGARARTASRSNRESADGSFIAPDAELGNRQAANLLRRLGVDSDEAQD
jgi:hypothetical protein